MIATTDPIADMLARLRNAIAVRHQEISLPHSKVKQAVAELLRDNGFVQAVRVEDARVGKTLVVIINDAGSNARITHIARRSKPGRRAYAGAGAIPTIKQGRGLVIISTSQGLMTGIEARKRGIGGEVMCEVY